MEKRTIVQAVIEILKSEKQPMAIQDITQSILDKDLYSFNTKEPRSIVRNAIERHCEGVNRQNSAASKLFMKSSDGKYTLK